MRRLNGTTAGMTSLATAAAVPGATAAAAAAAARMDVVTAVAKQQQATSRKLHVSVNHAACLVNCGQLLIYLFQSLAMPSDIVGLTSARNPNTTAKFRRT
jgi:hypothetical protein